MKNLHTLVLLAFVYFCTSCQTENLPVKQVEVDTFFSGPFFDKVKLSPDGNSIIRRNRTGETFFLEKKLREEESWKELSFDTKGSVRDFHWVDDKRIILQQQDNGSDNLYLINTCQTADNKILLKGLTSISALGNISGKHLYFMVQINGKQSLASYEKAKGSFIIYHSFGSAVEKVILNKEGWPLVYTTGNAYKSNIHYMPRGEDQQVILEINTIYDLFVPLGTGKDDSTIIAYSNIGRDKVCIVEYDLISNTESSIICSDPEYDLFGDDEYDRVYFSASDGRLACALYTREKRTYTVFDKKYKTVLNKVNKLLPGTSVRISGTDSQENTFLLEASSDRSRRSYFLFDTRQNQLIDLGSPYPGYNKEYIGKTRPIKYKARDGNTIHGYYTCPAGKAKAASPLMVIAHAGPAWRLSWDLLHDPDRQFFSNRGMAVLEINFRGSSGYGRDFRTSGYKQNNLDVLDDIVDGVNYIRRIEDIDTARIGIYGLSYGGGVVLGALTFYPEIFSAGIDLFGVSDYFAFFDLIPGFWDKTFFYETIGHPVKDSLMFDRISPLRNLERLTSPLFVAQGGKDFIISPELSSHLVEELESLGRQVEYFYREDEGHGFRKEENRIELWRQIDMFINRCLLE